MLPGKEGEQDKKVVTDPTPPNTDKDEDQVWADLEAQKPPDIGQGEELKEEAKVEPAAAPTAIAYKRRHINSEGWGIWPHSSFGHINESRKFIHLNFSSILFSSFFANSRSVKAFNRRSVVSYLSICSSSRVEE